MTIKLVRKPVTSDTINNPLAHAVYKVTYSCYPAHNPALSRHPIFHSHHNKPLNYMLSKGRKP